MSIFVLGLACTCNQALVYANCDPLVHIEQWDNSKVGFGLKPIHKPIKPTSKSTKPNIFQTQTLKTQKPNPIWINPALTHLYWVGLHIRKRTSLWGGGTHIPDYGRTCNAPPKAHGTFSHVRNHITHAHGMGSRGVLLND